MGEQEEKYGIDIEHAHPRATELIPEDFFWSCIDELAPFGSDEGDMALAEYRDWRKENPQTATLDCLQWVIESVGEMAFADYNPKITDRSLIKTQIQDDDFDDLQYIYTLDNSVIATGFAQLVDEGIIDQQNKPIIQLAIDRQKLWAELSEEWEHSTAYIKNLNVLERALQQA
ncbi:hypothetical protein [Lacibacter sp.]|uniref:hypothetical protein n=1 Tax=Lacibacter sp. TaxID=1915409 RepID=UPI002B4B76E9|nr:hypothetical protein [Lacibacter sp.]HLP39539.1 hypothetical protein [Lacibacter sp.]